MTKRQLERLQKNRLTNEVYRALVSRKIAERYSLPDELALLRQRDEKPEEFAAYHAYAEACKSEARREMGGNDS